VKSVAVEPEPAPRKPARTPAWKKKAEAEQAAAQEALVMVETQK
jgi:hypothetical protein